MFRNIEELHLASGALWPMSASFDDVALDLTSAYQKVAQLTDWKVIEGVKNQTASENLTQCIKASLSLFALDSYLDSHEVAHTISGRKTISSENEKTPWQWQIDRDKKNIVHKAHSFIYLSIELMKQNNECDWKNTSRGVFLDNLFLPSIDVFQRYFDIGNCHVFFLHLCNIMHLVQAVEVRPILGNKYDSYLANPLSHGRKYVDIIIALSTINLAVDRLMINIMPEGLVRRFVSSNANINSVSQLASTAEVASFKNNNIIEIKRYKDELLRTINEPIALSDRIVLPKKHWGI